MQDLIEYSNTHSLFPAECEVALGKYFPLLQKEEAKDVTVSCENPFGLNIITCKHPSKNEFINEVNGLTLDLQLTSEFENLPFYIPILDFGCKDFEMPSDYFGITLTDIVSKGVKLKAGRLHEQEEIRFRESILLSNAFKNKKVILFLTGSDTLIEWVWYNRIDYNFFNRITKMGFWAGSGFNFSVIGGECAFAQALNQKRSLYSCSLIEQNGILAIPHVYAITKFHIDRWVKWFIANSSIKVFTINCQLQKKAHDIAQIVTTVKEILTNVPYLHVILQGFHLNQIYQFDSCIDRIHFADKKPIKFAQNRRKILLDYKSNKLYDKIVMTESVESLAITNVLCHSAYIENMRQQIIGKAYKRA
jgi:hypothetical protein